MPYIKEKVTVDSQVMIVHRKMVSFHSLYKQISTRHYSGLLPSVLVALSGGASALLP